MKARILTGRLSAMALLPALLLSGTAYAGTLNEALAAAYRDNPTLTGARAQQRANDENVPIQKAGGRPQASLSASLTEQLYREQPLFTPLRTLNTSASVEAPFYSGGTVRNAVQAAKLRVEAGQQTLRGVEASVFTQVVSAYMDVIRGDAVVSLNRQNVRALEVNLRATGDRFEVGDLTRTDVAQSESRLAIARANLLTAEAQSIEAKERYVALVGAPPVALEPPPALPGLPETPELAVSVALAANPDILSTQKARDAATRDVRVAEGQVAPRLSAFVQGGYVNNLGTAAQSALVVAAQTSAAAGARLTLPLYQGGRPGAQQRQAVAREEQAMEDMMTAERNVIATTRASYASWQAALLTIESTRKAVDATALSLEGVKAENSVGNRTIIDILNAEQESLNARVQLVTAERNAYVAAFSLLASMGRAQAQDLNLEGVQLYDPVAQYRSVSGKMFDFDFRPAAKPQAQGTSAIPAQTSEPDRLLLP